MNAVLDKTAATTVQNKLVATWIGSSVTDSVAVRVLSINGRDAQVQYTVDGHTMQGTGDVYKNTVTLGKVVISSDDGVHGTVIFPVGRSTLSLAVTKYVPKTASSVNKLA
jgi:hypothetical protein